MIWYLADLRRFLAEREALDRLAAANRWLVPGEWRTDDSLRVVWDAEIVTDERAYKIALTYPNHFPHSPPQVHPRDATERWSDHQYGDAGELCLEYGPDNWHAGLSGAIMVESAFRLLHGQSTLHGIPAPVPSRHATTVGQELRTRRIRLLTTQPLLDYIADLPVLEVVKAKIIGTALDGVTTWVVPSIVRSDSTTWRDPSIPSALLEDGFERIALLAKWPAEEDVLTSANARAYIDTMGDPELKALIVAQGSEIYGYRFVDETKTYPMAVIRPSPVEQRVDADHLHLAVRRVAVVGLGSLGSKIALSLARAGVGSFLLVDVDVMMPENLIRHDLDWRDVGGHKAAGVARRIALVNCSAVTETRLHKLGGQEASGSIETLISSLSSCDLILDATANPKAFGYLCAAASVGKKAVLWAQVFAGGFGGMIARHRPGFEPDPLSIKSAIEAWCAERQVAAPAPVATDYASADGAMIADDADVTVIAAHAARMAVDTLIPRDPSWFPYSVYMIGLSKGLFFSQPFESFPISLDQTESTPSAPLPPELVVEGMRLVVELFANRSNASPDSKTDSQPPQE